MHIRVNMCCKRSQKIVSRPKAVEVLSKISGKKTVQRILYTVQGNVRAQYIHDTYNQRNWDALSGFPCTVSQLGLLHV